MRFEIPFKLPGFNDFLREANKNRYCAAKTKKQRQYEIRLFMGRLRPVRKPVVIQFTWYEATRKRDKDNVCFAKKLILDALQEKGILPNDNNRWVLGFVDKFVYCQGQKVVVDILEVDEV